ncbi:MAG: hypothetical protein H6624_11550 [Bdellovibrionaceae bacterium]|nr:hypothetical protein [Bdellovibrionales bacterium]MCB9084974.1 hypothetical protein [Pseudobdellovibrionaceae bacterium]
MKDSLQALFVRPHELKTREGLPTGSTELDQFLIWQGIPKGAVSLLVSSHGRGATSLWGDTAIPLTQQKKWVAWMNSSEHHLCPWSWWQKKMDFSRLLVVSSPDNRKKFLWALHELLSLSLFDLIGCDLGELQLRDSDVLKLSRHARRAQAAVVLTSANRFVRRSSFYSLILNFNSPRLKIERAQHRLTPHTIKRRNTYADLVPQLAQNRKALSS